MKHKNIVTAIVCFLVICMVLICTTCLAHAEDNSPIWTHKMEVAHEAADILRAYGYAENSPAIFSMKMIWLQEKENLDITARVIMGEGGYCDFDFKVCVGAVLRNRVEYSEHFPDSYSEAVSQPGQYTTAYLTGFEKTTRECYEAAKYVLDGKDDVPHDVVWQANFPQGRETWKIIEVDTGWYKSTNYFCRGIWGERPSGFGGNGYGG